MAEKIVIELDVNTLKGQKQIDDLKNSFNKLESSLTNVKESSDKTKESIDEVASNGGAIATWDEYTEQWFRMYRDNGKPHTNSYGTNSRMSEVDAAQMLVKLKYIDSWQDRRYEIAEYYIQRFKDEAPRVRTFMSDMLNRHMHGLQKFVIEIDHRDRVKDLLYQDGIECKVHYERPLHEMEPYEVYSNLTMINNASMLSRRVLSLPFYPELTDSEIKYIADRVIKHVADQIVH